jgi:hypothetical protein
MRETGGGTRGDAALEMQARPVFNTEAQKPQGSQGKNSVLRAKRNDCLAFSEIPEISAPTTKIPSGAPLADAASTYYAALGAIWTSYPMARSRFVRLMAVR